MPHARVDGVTAHDGAPPTLRKEHSDYSLQRRATISSTAGCSTFT